MPQKKAFLSKTKEGDMYEALGFQFFMNLVRIAVFFILSGEMASCTVDMRAKAQESMSRELLNLGTLNRSLN